jgi:hypothetical protein
MKKRFRMHDIGSVSFYLGMNIECNLDHLTIDIHQHSYIRTISEKFRINEARPGATAMARKRHKRKPDVEACDATIHQSIIGSHMYAITVTRPDIAFDIGVPSWYNQYPRNEHRVALKHMFRYLNGTKDWRLGFGGALGGESEGLLGSSVDSDDTG